MSIAILLAFSFTATAILAASFLLPVSQKSSYDEHDGATTNVSSHGKRGKRMFETIKYEIKQFGCDVDLGPTESFAEELASASKKSVVRDDSAPNFVVLLIASDTHVVLTKVLISLGAEMSESAREKLESEILNFQQSIRSKAMTFGETHTTIRKGNHEPIFVTVIVRPRPINSVFLGIEIRDSMKHALGLY